MNTEQPSPIEEAIAARYATMIDPYRPAQGPREPMPTEPALHVDMQQWADEAIRLGLRPGLVEAYEDHAMALEVGPLEIAALEDAYLLICRTRVPH